MSGSLFILLESSAPQHNRQTPCQPCSRPASARPSRWFCPCFTRPVRQGELASASCSASRHISWQCRPMPLDRNDYPDRSTCVCRVPFAYPNASNPPTVKCPAARVILQANWHQRWLPTAPRTRASHKACQATPGYPPPTARAHYLATGCDPGSCWKSHEAQDCARINSVDSRFFRLRWR